MKNIYLYFKNQYIFLAISLLLIIIPFTASLIYLSEIPHLQYLFLLVLILLKLLVFNDQERNKKQKSKIAKELTKELKKSPSSQAIFNRSQFYNLCRDITLSFNALYIIIASILLERF